MLYIFGLILFLCFLIFIFLGFSAPNELPAKVLIIIAGVFLMIFALTVLSTGIDFPTGWAIGLIGVGL